MILRALFAFTLAFALMPSPRLRAAEDDTWTLTTADFRKVSVTVSSIGADGVKVTETGGEAKTVPLDRVLRLDRDRKPIAVSAPPKYTLFLQRGDRIAGEPVELKDEVLTWRSPAVGELKLGLDKLRALAKSGAAPAGLDDEHKEDAVLLSNHDVVRGVVAGIADGKVTVQSNNEAVPVPFASADAIVFASPAAKAAGANPARAFRVRLVDGSLFTSPDLKLESAKLSLNVAGGGKDDRATDVANAVTVEQVNGPVSWLSDRTPTANKQVPFNAETTYPAKMDANVFGRPLRYNGQSFERGIGTHANSVVTFALDPAAGYHFFRTRYAIDTSMGDAGRASVNVRVLADDKVVYEQKGFGAYQLSPPVVVDLGKAKVLTLEVTAAGPTDTQDRLNWLEPALLREAPAAEPAARTTAPAATTRPASAPAAK